MLPDPELRQPITLLARSEVILGQRLFSLRDVLRIGLRVVGAVEDAAPVGGDKNYPVIHPVITVGPRRDRQQHRKTEQRRTAQGAQPTPLP